MTGRETQARAPSARHVVVDLVEDLIRDGRLVRIRVTGRSMLPWLRDGEVVTLRRMARGTGRLGDLLLFRNRSGSMVLHRVVGRKGIIDGSRRYLLKGDSLARPDDPVHDEQIIGKVVAVSRRSRRGAVSEVTLESALRRAVCLVLAVASSWTPRLFHAVSCRVAPLMRLAEPPVSPDLGPELPFPNDRPQGLPRPRIPCTACGSRATPLRDCAGRRLASKDRSSRR